MVFPQPDPGGIQQIIERGQWRQQLALDYQATAARLLEAYTRVLPDLRAAAQDLTGRMSEWEAANPGRRLSGGDVSNFREYAALLRRVEIEMRDFAALLRNEAAGLQEKGVLTGARAALELATGTAGGQAPLVQMAWNQPSAETLARLVGYVDSAAFRTNAATFGENAAQNLADVILTGVAQGMNPRTTAEIINTWWAIPYSWADNSVRTVQMYSYRTASHATYAANPRVLDGWVWYASLDSRCCLSCVSQHGKQFPLSETLNDHHRGRCVEVPVVRGATWPELIISGPNWFETLPEDQQRQQMGGALWRAWNDGAVGWSDMSQPYQDPVYGEMLREASVSGVLGAEPARQYYWYNVRAG